MSFGPLLHRTVSTKSEYEQDQFKPLSKERSPSQDVVQTGLRQSQHWETNYIHLWEIGSNRLCTDQYRHYRNAISHAVLVKREKEQLWLSELESEVEEGALEVRKLELINKKSIGLSWDEKLQQVRRMWSRSNLPQRDKPEMGGKMSDTTALVLQRLWGATQHLVGFQKDSCHEKCVYCL